MCERERGSGREGERERETERDKERETDTNEKKRGELTLSSSRAKNCFQTEAAVSDPGDVATIRW